MKLNAFKLSKPLLWLHPQLLLIMKLTTFILLIALAQVNANTFAQKINLNEKNVPLATVLNNIESQTGYVFFCTDYDLKKPLVNVKVKNVTLEEALLVCFKNLPLGYKIVAKTIVIQQTSIPLPDGFKADLNLTINIKGKIIDENRNPLAAATVKVKDTKLATISDANGEFLMSNVSDKAVLQISFIGYITKEISVKQNLNAIQLLRDSSKLSDVVIVGYGTQKKVDVTGAVSSIKMDDILKDRPLSNVAAVLEGALPGLTITSTSGQPGTAFNLNVRGYTSLNGGAPLVLVDNVPLDPTRLGDINPQDIQDVSVLKDAAASAIYGARAAFGVILITTKKGSKNQPTKFEYSSNFTNTRASSLPEKLTPLEEVNALLTIGTPYTWEGANLTTYQTLLQQYEQNPSQFPGGYTISGGQRYALSNNPQYKIAFPGGFEQLHNFAASGGGDKTFFRTSMGYDSENGVIIGNNDSYRKWNLNTSLTTQLTKTLSMYANVFYDNIYQTTPYNASTFYYDLIQNAPWAPTGIGTLPSGRQAPYFSADNLAQLEPPSVLNGNQIKLSTKMDFTPVKNLVFTGEYAFNQTSSYVVNVNQIDTLVNPNLYIPRVTNSTSSYSKNNYTTIYQVLNLYGKYAIHTNRGHNFDFLIGMNQEISKESDFTISRTNLLISSLPSISTATGTISGSDGYNSYAVSGYFGRANYNYRDRYLFEVNARYDGSSRFPEGHRFGFFPSASVGWNVMNESFAQPLTKIFSLLKLRASYGTIGNQNVGYYSYLSTLTPYSASWLNQSTGVPYLTLTTPALVSSNYSWEQVQTTNFGVDVGLFKSRLTGSFEYYIRRTLNMLVASQPLPTILGTSAPTTNAADLKTIGTELEIKWSDRIGKVKYNIGVNITNSNAFITRYNNPTGSLSSYYVGQRLGDIWGLQSAGYFTTADFVSGTLNSKLTGGTLLSGIAHYTAISPNPGDMRYADLNGDGVTNSGQYTLANHGDYKIIGNSAPRYKFGILGGVSYSGFDFTFYIQGVAKADAYYNNQVVFPYQNQYQYLLKNQLDFWTPTNLNAHYARLYPYAAGYNTYYSDLTQTKYLYNAAYLRIKSLNLGYTLPQKLVKKISLDRVRVFVSGENILTLDYLPKGMDPESDNAYSGVEYPFLKKYSFGINVTF